MCKNQINMINTFYVILILPSYSGMAGTIDRIVFSYLYREGVLGGILGSWEWGFLLTGKLGIEISLTGNWESSI